ncbi:hypothetical protein [Enterococcus bulliens]
MYIPLSIVLGLFGFDILYGTLSAKKDDEEFNPEYYSHKNAPMFRKKQAFEK